MKYVLILLMCAFVVSCTSISEQRQAEEQLEIKLAVLMKECNQELAKIESLRNDIADYEYQIQEASNTINVYNQGREPQYIVKFNLRQSHFSLDLVKRAKDAINAIEFELPVNKEFYNSIEIGTQVIDKFRVGSLILYGSIGNWHMSVINKEIR